MKTPIFTLYLLIVGLVSTANATPLWCQGSDGYWYNVASYQQMDQVEEKFNLTNCSPSSERTSTDLEAMASDISIVAVVKENDSTEIVYNVGIANAVSHLAKLQRNSENILSDKILTILELKATHVLRCSSNSGVALIADNEVWAAELAGFTKCEDDLRLSSNEQSEMFFIKDGKLDQINPTKKNDILKEYTNFKIRNKANEEKLITKLYPVVKNS